MLASETALAAPQEEAGIGRTGLPASQAALALSQEEIRVGQTALLASGTASIALELLTQDLEHARDAAEDANRARSRLLAAVLAETRANPG